MLKNLREELLCCCKENVEVLAAAGKTNKQAIESNFTGTDYEHFLTSEPEDKGKYRISAFYNTFQAIADAIDLVNRWNSFIKPLLG